LTEDQERNMRNQLADYAKGELIDLAISLQDVIDDHVNEKRGMQGSIDNMSQQLPALRAQLEEYENSDPVDSEEVESLRQQVNLLNIRNNELQTLNEGLQKKLIG
jgi:prefoldin subunit 5